MNWFFTFPFKLQWNPNSIDTVIRNFSIDNKLFFDGIKIFLTQMITLVHSIISFVPWWIYLVVVFVLSYLIKRNWRTGLLYAGMLSLIGFFGLWELMMITLSIVLTSVFLSLVFGFPMGILMSFSERANNILRPVLDTMQTMPVFVYLIPAVMFFGLGKAPAVLATTIYAIVPIIRLTNLGIRQVDIEVVEAARAFGSTNLQTMIKVQIPQAKPTIMAGLNQTLMMAMAMVVTCSMIGASGLGMEVLISVNRIEMGRGLVSGLAVVIVAVILDRLSQSLAKDKEQTQ
ncbi:MAG: ABC transporter permease subunit [Erysipelotrichales bacterium]|nr:MAG: ABC transporter permease subunit [Erysipelotrichales bacterium]